MPRAVIAETGAVMVVGAKATGGTPWSQRAPMQQGWAPVWALKSAGGGETGDGTIQLGAGAAAGAAARAGAGAKQQRSVDTTEW